MKKAYSIDQCALYKLSSKTRLARTLKIPKSDLDRLVDRPTFHTVINDGKIFYPPVGKLRKVHDRLLFLLKSVETRDYHCSDKKGCSNVINAGRHAPEGCILKTDIKNYFPSVSQTSVKQFFKHKLRTNSSVASALSKLICKDGFLVKGSPVSGFIAFWSNVDIFDNVANICEEAGAVFTLFVDDLTISFSSYKPSLLRRVDGVLIKSGFVAHKQKVYKPHQEKVVTGIVLTPGRGYRAKKSTFLKAKGGSPRSSRLGAQVYTEYVDRQLNE